MLEIDTNGLAEIPVSTRSITLIEMLEEQADARKREEFFTEMWERHKKENIDVTKK